MGDLAPAIFERRQIFDAVVLHRLEQSLEPLASGRVVRGLDSQDRDQLIHGAEDRGAKGAGRGVNPLERRPDALHQRHDAVSRPDRIGFRHGLDLGGSFLETADGKTRGSPAIDISAKLRLELPLSN